MHATRLCIVSPATHETGAVVVAHKAPGDTRGHIQNIKHGIKVVFLEDMVGHSFGLREWELLGDIVAMYGKMRQFISSPKGI